MNQSKIVVLGAGFGGIEAVKELSKLDVDVILIDRNNFHQFTPLLYQVATAEIENEEIIFPVRQMIRDRENITFVRDEVIGISSRYKQVITQTIEINYDYLVIALGSRTAYYNIPGAEEFTFPMKTLAQAMNLKNHILCSFEKAEMETDSVYRRKLLSFVIVGGGPTGVEFAGALSELVFGPLLKDHPRINREEISIHIIDSGEVVLKQFHDKLNQYATKRLENMGVTFERGCRVVEVSRNRVYLSDGRVLESGTTVWTAGIRGHDFVRELGFEITKNNLIQCHPTLQTTSHEDVFVVGDLAFIAEGPIPALATVAIQEGRHVAKNIGNLIEHREMEDFEYKDKGSMAVIGRNSVVIQTKRLKLVGTFAWMIWSVLHVFKLSGVRNRLNVMINWFWSYIFSENTARTILPELSEDRILAHPVHYITKQ